MRTTITSRRLALVSASLLIGLTACGSPSGSSSPATVATTAAAADRPAVIRIAGSAGGVSNASAEAMPTADSKMMMPMNITYVFDGTAVDLTAPAGAWSFPTGVAATPEQVAALAGALGVVGDVRPIAADLGGGYMVGPDDWSGPTLTVSADSTLGWWYNPGPTAGVAVPDCAIAIDPMPIDASADTVAGDVTTPAVAPCPEPEPPANVPSKAEAEQAARQLFTELGLDLGQYELETYADEWGASVTAWLVLDGMRTSMTASIGFGAEGAVTWAAGFLATPVRGDDYPRIGVDAAVTRLNDQASQWMYPMATARGGVAPAEPAPGDTMPVDTMPVDTMPVDTEPVVVTLTSVSPSLEMTWADDGTVWLLPGYSFTSADGGTYSVIAVTDEYLVQVQPPVIPVDTVMPADPGTVSNDPSAPGTLVEAPLSLDEVAALVVGKSEADAQAAVEAAGLAMRVVRIDGVDQAITMDYRIDRYNVAVEAGVVTAVISNG